MKEKEPLNELEKYNKEGAREAALSLFYSTEQELAASFAKTDSTRLDQDEGGESQT